MNCSKCKFAEKAKKVDYQTGKDGVHQVYCVVKEFNVPSYYLCWRRLNEDN